MSVLIKDMDMPETCDDCPFHVYHSHYEYVCIATPMFYPMNLANSKGIRKDWCPLVETPEPCGDAISRQAAIDAVEKKIKKWNVVDGEGYHVGIGLRCMDVIDMLTELPSAQPDGIPLEWIDKHLEWLDNCDNDFAQLAKVGIRAMVGIWKKDKT